MSTIITRFEELQEQAINVWQNRQTTPNWREQIIQCMNEAFHPNNLQDAMLSNTQQTPNNTGIWITYYVDNPTTAEKAWQKTLGENNFINDMFTRNPAELDEALLANPPSRTIGRELPKKQWTQYNQKTSQAVWEHYRDAVDPVLVLKNIPNCITPQTPKWQSGAKRAIRELFNEAGWKLPYRTISWIIAHYPNQWETAQPKIKDKIKHAEWATAPLETIPQKVIREWYTSNTLQYVRAANGNIVEISQTPQALNQPQNPWQNQTIELETAKLTVKDENKIIERGATEIGWRIGPTSIFVENDEHKQALERSGFKVHTLNSILPEITRRRWDERLCKHPTQTVAFTLKYHAGNISANTEAIPELHAISNETDDPTVRTIAQHLIENCLLNEELTIEAMLNDYGKIQPGKTRAQNYKMLRETYAPQHRIPNELLSELL